MTVTANDGRGSSSRDRRRWSGMKALGVWSGVALAAWGAVARGVDLAMDGDFLSSNFRTATDVSMVVGPVIGAVTFVGSALWSRFGSPSGQHLH